MSHESYFDQVALSFAEFSETPLYDQRVRAFLEQAEVDRPTDRRPRCLDIGCGPGGLSVAFANHGFEVLGVDASAQMLDRAQRAAASAHLPISLRQIDLSVDFPVLDFSPELIVCSSVLEYLERPADVVRRAARVLAPGGLFLVSVPNHESLVRRVEQARYALRGRGSYVDQQRSSMTYKELISTGEAAGLHRLATRHFSAPPNIERWSRWRLIGTLTLIAFRKPTRSRRPATPRELAQT